MNLRRSLENLFRGQAVLLTTRSKDDPNMAVPVTPDNPLPVTVLDGSVGGGAGGTSGTPTILSRQTLTLTASAQGLTVPAGATAARISVRGGNASVAVTTPAPTASEGDLWPDGSMWELNKNELAGFRAVIASGGPVLQVTYLGGMA